jgi:hypothetical protein
MDRQETVCKASRSVEPGTLVQSCDRLSRSADRLPLCARARGLCARRQAALHRTRRRDRRLSRRSGHRRGYAQPRRPAVDRPAGRSEDTRCRVSPADAERIVRLVAHHVGVEVHTGSPRVSAELPETGERFEGLTPPVVAVPCLAIRRPAVAVFTLGDYYVGAGIKSAGQVEVLRRAGQEAEERAGRRRQARRRSSRRFWPRSPRPATASS